MFTKFLISLLFLLPLTDKSPQEKYIELYAPVAIEEMNRSGVPASITLAQGLLESNCGQSDLAVKGNNHFGIKCHSDWSGKTMKVDDDRSGECFRVYKDASESFTDHSDFLRFRPRYQFLFDYPMTDYNAWAQGLKKAGYATDPSYPSKLVRLIEEYQLFRFDVCDSGDEYIFEDLSEPVIIHKDVKPAKKSKSERRQKPTVIPPAPSSLEMPEPVSDEDFSVPLTRAVYKLNGVKFIYSEEGETYSSIAESYNLFKKEILMFNDAVEDAQLLPGTVVYIQAKKKQAVKGLEKYIVEKDGEELRDVAQRYAVKMTAISKMNGFSEGHKLKEGDTILMR